MNEPILKVDRLSHRYATAWAIQDISFEIHQAGILGLLGSNGAGKSTTMNIMCGVLNQTQGDVYIGGIDLRKDPEEAKKLLGFLPQNPPLYLDLTVEEYLQHCAVLRKIPAEKVKNAIAEAMERCQIAHFSKRLLNSLSGGYRQRVGIAQAIIHKPKLVVLDEPTNGLDPNQIVEVRALIREIAQERAVIFSTHILTEVQLLCKDIRMIEQGRLVFADTIEAFNNYVAPHSVIMELAEPPALEQLMGVHGITRVEYLTEQRIKAYFDGDHDITERLIETSVQNGWRLREISLDKNSVDEVFAQLSNNKKK